MDTKCTVIRDFKAMNPMSSCLPSTYACKLIREKIKTLETSECGALFSTADIERLLSTIGIPLNQIEFLLSEACKEGGKENFKNLSTQQKVEIVGDYGDPGTGIYYGPEFGDPLDLDEKLIARYITQKDWQIFKGIKRHDLPQHMPPNLSDSSVILQALRQNYSQIHYWTINTILLGNDASARSVTIRKFIKIAKELLQMNNLNAAHAIVSALQNNAIERLEKSWKKLSIAKKSLFKYFSNIFSEENNYVRLYFYMKEQMDVNKICIPYMALVIRDFKAMQPLCPDLRVLTIRRSGIMLKILKNLETKLYGTSTSTIGLEHFWTALFISSDEIKVLKSKAYQTSLKLEPSKYRHYKILNVSDISLSD